MMRFILLFSVLTVLTACASHWEHSTKLPSEFRADDQACQLISGGASRSLDPGSGDRQGYENCMWERGWRKTNTIWFFDPKPR